jgi:UDP-N-acetylglucosamine 2-epimerase (non-hydrolysing)
VLKSPLRVASGASDLKGKLITENLTLMIAAGARPNFIKVAPLIRAINDHNAVQNGKHTRLKCILVHTGQHYDIEMSGQFFGDLDLPRPDINLEVGSGSHAVQTANILLRFEKVCLREKPDWLLVVGDVNSTVACALVAAKSGIRVGHVEAGLRSFDRSMPEEINRVVTDVLADLLFTPSEDADENLRQEGISSDKIKRVGNIMIDSLISNLEKARRIGAHTKLGLMEKQYAVVTLHRPANVDSQSHLLRIMDCLSVLAQRLPVVFPVHPRTRAQLESLVWNGRVKPTGLLTCNPMGYHEFIGLVDKARVVLTDSGGLQEETTFLGIPCLTLRPNTERPITLTHGTNRLTSLDTLQQDMEHVLNGQLRSTQIPDLWDGMTARRILDILIHKQVT